MKASVYCVTTAKGESTFYLRAEGKDYLLFIQNYKKSTREFFVNGQPLDRALSTSGVHSRATLKTIEKLRPAIIYVEKEYGISVLNSTLRKNDKKKAPYKRQKAVSVYEYSYAA